MPAMIERIPFGSTGHDSSRVIFGAAALWRADADEAARALALLDDAGINHIDVASSYGDAELRVGEWMATERDRFFLATKTKERGYAKAREELNRSLERLRVDRIDLIQMHNLVGEDDWQTAFGDDGALRALREARDQGLVRFIGVTGHGTRVAAMHARSLEHFAFDSVLVPYNFSLMRDPVYADQFEALHALCRERGVAMQTIKSIARRRWTADAPEDRQTWYEPMTDRDDIARSVAWVLERDGVFLNSASDLGLLPAIVAAAAADRAAPDTSAMEAAEARLGVEPLFVRGYGAPAA